MEQSPSARTLVLSPLGLRKAIGTIGFLLPFVLAVGRWFTDGPGMESSISSYYYTGMHDVFVGAMCAIGVLLFSYRGYDPADDVAGDLAAVFAIGLALVPTAPDVGALPHQQFLGEIHRVLAAAFFGMLGYFSLFLFTKSAPDRIPTRQKMQRNQVYRACGTFIVAALLLIVLVKQLPENSWLMRFDPVFWLESVAVVAFGISWLIKGELFFKDARIMEAQWLPERE